jgi:anaerobic magnesium-protoporphyrin IX monomethyl ester cyclase
MRILLINPSLLQADISHYKKSVEKNRGIYPPLGIAYVASSLIKSGHKVKLVDCDVEDDFVRKINQVCRRFNPELVGFYAMTWTFRLDSQMLMEIKKILPKVKSVIGGPNVSAFPKESLEFSNFDFAVKGEGEITAVELVEALEKKRTFSSVDGLIWRNKGKIIQNKDRQLISNLNLLPFPAWDLLPVKKYNDVFTKNSHFVTMLATRGCPYRCTFCDRDNRMGRNWRMRNPKAVIEEMKFINKKYGIKEFMFFDDNFLVNRKWVLDFCRLIKNYHFLWEVRARVDTVDKELLIEMKSAGCYRIRYGMESADNRTLKTVKKDITVEQIKRCANFSHEAKIEIFAYFMLGLPGENTKKMQKTLDLAIEIDPDFLLLSKTILIPGSEMFDWAAKKGYIDKNYWLRFLQGLETEPAPGLVTPILNEKTIENYVSKGNRSFYLRPRYVLKRILSVRSYGQLVRQVRMAISLFLN